RVPRGARTGLLEPDSSRRTHRTPRGARTRLLAARAGGPAPLRTSRPREVHDPACGPSGTSRRPAQRAANGESEGRAAVPTAERPQPAAAVPYAGPGAGRGFSKGMGGGTRVSMTGAETSEERRARSQRAFAAARLDGRRMWLLTATPKRSRPRI